MQVRVLRQYPAGSSAYGVVEAENDAARRVVGLIAEAESARLLVPEAARLGAGLIVRSEMQGAVPAWMPGPRHDFERMMVEVEEAARAAGIELCIWPTAHGVISDAPSLLSFLKSAAERGSAWRFLLDPVSMLTREMLTSAEDHVERIFQTLSGHTAAWGVVLASAIEREEDVLSAPLNGVEALTSTILASWAKWRSPLPVVLVEGYLERQLALLKHS